MTSEAPELKYAHWAAIPRHMHQPLRDYLELHRPVGDFLTAVLSNDLAQAASHADAVNRVFLAEYAVFLHNFAPAAAWGSPEKVAAWLADGPQEGTPA